MTEIGLSGLLLDSPYSGTAVYTRGLVPWLPRVAPEFSYRLFTRHAQAQLLGIPAESFCTPFDRLAAHPVGARLDKLTWETVSLPLHALARRQGLLHSLYFAAPMATPAPLVVTVHDLIPLLLPGYHRSRQAALYSALMAWTVRRAQAIITVSEHSKRDIVRVLGVPEERVHVTYEAVEERFRPAAAPGEAACLRRKYDLPEAFLLYLGGAERRKNVATLLRAWAEVRRRQADAGVKLVIVARFPPPDALYPDIPGLIQELGLADSVHLIPAVSADHQPALYRTALAFAYPSIYEGFGLPSLEAMACGTPVLAGKATSVPEVTGEAALLLAPEDVSIWADAIQRVLAEPSLRADLSRRGLDRAARFSWEETARGTAAVYRKVLACA